MSTINTSTTGWAIVYPIQRKGFYAAGLFWAFYSNGTNAVYEHSHDGTIWAEGATSIGACAGGYDFSVHFDGTYIHYVRYSNRDLFYRRGTPVNDGTITWSAVEQTVYDGLLGDEYKYPTITVDTSGYAWIGVLMDDPTPKDLPLVLKNDNNDGTWALDFATELSAVSDGNWRCVPVALTSDKVYVCYVRHSQSPLGKLYNAGWGGEENDIADFNIEASVYVSVTSISDDVHFAYNRDVTYQIRHNVRVWGEGWNANDMIVVDGMTSTTAPTISADPSTGEIYCFWALASTDHVYYKIYDGDWDAAPVDWIDETADDIPDDRRATAFYEDYGGYIGLLYTTKTGSPYNVRFEFLSVESREPPFIIHTHMIVG